MSGGAAGKKPADDDAVTGSRNMKTTSTLMVGFDHLFSLTDATWKGIPEEGFEIQVTLEEMKEKILGATGLELVHSIWTTCSDDLIKRFEAFSAKHGTGDKPSGTQVFMFHGTSGDGTLSICADGMNLDMYKCGYYGKGMYVTPEIQYAIPYCKSKRLPSGKRLLCVVFGFAEFGMPPEKVPVGSKDQEDFGRLDDGREICVASNEDQTYFCLKEEAQFMPIGFFVFSIDTKKLPSDFALRHMIYPEDVWAQMKENIPGLVERKEMLKASFNAGGSRQQPPRASKAPGASKAWRYKPF
jgi:hypothetical protein